ncbi:MAG: calcium/sodium antiporter [Oscillospiraceae bacterium]|nr:calcium/sodium antiporter [Oscillospiraceae bacterium]
MAIFLAVVLFIAGTALIIKGGEIFVDAASWISDVTGISKVVIGATLVSFATTSPEYFVSLIANIKGHNELSIGNAVGSVSANIGIAFALLAIFTPGKITDRLFGAKGAIMLASAAALLVLCMDGRLSAIEGAVLLLFFAVSIFVNIRYSKEGEEDKKRKQADAREIAANTAKFIFGAAAVVFGSNLIVDNAQLIAAALGVSESVIGLTVVAVGTSLPEIATSAAAAIKKQTALSIGNIIGANILDVTLILSTGAFVSGGNLTVSQKTADTDMPAALILMALAVLPSAIGKKIYRWQGIAAAGIYAAYLAYVVFF